MKQIFLTLILLTSLVNNNYAQEAEQPEVPLFQFFHMYMEYGSGELSNPYGERLFENLDVKMTYNQNFRGAKWLSLGFIGQVTWDNPSMAKPKPSLSDPGAMTSRMAVPNKMLLSATMGFFQNMLTLSASTEGIIATTVYYNKVLPPTPGLYSHDLTILFAPNFYAGGNKYNDAGILTQGWFDKLEMRVAYRMKFNQYVGLRPEFLFNITGTEALKGNGRASFMFRFNPRLQFYAEQFSFFIEPRFFFVGDRNFYGPLNSDSGFFWEIKVGFDIAHFIVKE